MGFDIKVIETGTNNMLLYKGMVGSIEIDLDNEILHGKILNIDSLCLYEGNTVRDLKEDFKNAVDQYLEEISY